jgi:hypothetical protein
MAITVDCNAAVNTLTKLGDIHIWNTPDGKIATSFAKAEIKDGSFLVSDFGVGNTFEEALKNYANKISGKTLVFDAYTDHRREVFVWKM